MIEADAKVVESLPGSPAPLDLFEPHMPGVNVLSDMTALFKKARLFSAERHHIAIVTPDRMIMGLAGPTPGSVPDSALAAPKALLGTEIPLQIAAISYTKAMENDEKDRILGFEIGIDDGFVSVHIE